MTVNFTAIPACQRHFKKWFRTHEEHNTQGQNILC